MHASHEGMDRCVENSQLAATMLQAARTIWGHEKQPEQNRGELPY
jgi:hypothetical protein